VRCVFPSKYTTHTIYKQQFTNKNNMAANARPRVGIASVDCIMANETLYLRLWGEPIAQPRPRARLGTRGGRIIVYDPSTRFKAAGRILLDAALTEIGLADRPVFTTRRSILIQATFFTAESKKDIDNMLKFLLDVLEGPIYSDDRYVVEIRAKKHQEPQLGRARTDVEVEYI
jgi:Holliday junction resolvase RusA-like endonuclease